MDPNMMNAMSQIGATDNPNDPEAVKRAMMLRMLMNQKQQGGHAGGVSQLGNSLMAALLMNPQAGMMIQNKLSGMFGPSSVGGIGEG